jgi:hypothetical protein
MGRGARGRGNAIHLRAARRVGRRRCACGRSLPGADLPHCRPPPPRGWQWLFLLEGIPAAIIGCCVWAFMPASADAARFLDPAERAALAEAVAADSAASPSRMRLPEILVLVRQAVANPYLWLMALATLMTSVTAQVGPHGRAWGCTGAAWGLTWGAWGRMRASLPRPCPDAPWGACTRACPHPAPTRPNPSHRSA